MYFDEERNLNICLSTSYQYVRACKNAKCPHIDKQNTYWKAKKEFNFSPKATFILRSSLQASLPVKVTVRTLPIKRF